MCLRNNVMQGIIPKLFDAFLEANFFLFSACYMHQNTQICTLNYFFLGKWEQGRIHYPDPTPTHGGAGPKWTPPPSRRISDTTTSKTMFSKLFIFVITVVEADANFRHSFRFVDDCRVFVIVDFILTKINLFFVIVLVDGNNTVLPP